MNALEDRFHRAMLDIYVTAREECDYNATRFLGMINDRDSNGVIAAHRLLASEGTSEGFTALWKCKRLDLTVEAHVLKPEYASLFSEEEREIARRRLEDIGYKFA